ncbi:PSK1 Serine/threonine-protein kinase PSK1 [Candida maltosa Xu316]
MQSNKSSLFYIGEDIKQPPPPIRSSINPRQPPLRQDSPKLSPITPTTTNSNNNNNEYEDILKFPIESSHAYSYAHLSPNSLALRLNVLKRSLEILKDRPELFKSLTKDKPTSSAPLSRQISNTMEVENTVPEDEELFLEPPPSKRSLYNHTNHSSDYIHDISSTSPGSTNEFKKYKLRSNASSATLAALFRPSVKRSDSLPIDNAVVTEITELPSYKTTTTTTTRRISSKQLPNDDFKDIIDLLENDLDSLMSNSEIATTLHDLSLSTPDESNSLSSKHDLLKHKLLYALAMPFMENSVQTTSLLESDGTTDPSLKSARIRPSTTALNLLNNNYSSPIPSQLNPNLSGFNNSNANPSRPFHSLLATKHSLPQSVFTIEPDLPFSVKAANDLACLMFGVSKNTIKALTLMDLIAPQFRDFVLDRLTTFEFTSPSRTKSQDNILFAGEIVAIVRPGDQNFAWTSLWAKRKGGLIICMFDQIPCDAFDVVISWKTEAKLYEVQMVHEIAGKLVEEYDISKITRLHDISDSLSKELHEIRDEDITAQDTEDVALINHTRYFTLQLDDENIPCAITSNPLDENDIKLKIHTMPYIAGIFVINSTDYSILSCNNAIARNLFGKSFDDINGHSIDELIPNFSKILKIGIESSFGDYELLPGLVLPEHFFRKYDAIVKQEAGDSSSTSQESAESIFFNSNGLEGIHRDGKTIYIDAQLRASSRDTLVVWITYSRTNKTRNNITEELDKLSSASASASSISLASSNKSATSLTSTNKSKSSHLKISDLQELGKHERTMSTNVPSQMKLFDNEKEKDLLEFSPREITRASSTRKPKRETSLGLPLTRLDSYIYKKEGDTSTPDAKNLLTPIGSHDLIESENTAPSSPAANTDYHINSKFTEEEILEIENTSLEKIKKESSHWPQEVGSLRRTKKFSEFKVLKNMGEGAYGKVVLAQHRQDPLYKIIIKCIDKERILVDTWVRDRKLGTIPSEIQIMAYLNTEPHPNIMRIIDFFEDSKYYYLETPIFGNPPAIDLFDFIEIEKDLNEVECKFIFRQIVSSIYHLHKNGIVHRDIKDENIIIDEKGIIKLIDFGSAGYVKQGPFDVFVGTIDYASPEVLRGEKYEGKPQDIWALGILLYTMLYKENPFYNVDEIMEGDLRIPYIISDPSLNLIRKILIRDVEHRPTITDIMDDEWLA